MFNRSVLCAFFSLLCLQSKVAAQRTYAPRSVLADGNWYKLAIKEAGVYKIDLPLLTAMGVPTANLAASQIRLFGNGGSMLPENNASPRPDDLLQNALLVVDGGDGLLNGNDYVLFYAPGPHQWQNKEHIQHLYTDSVYYFLNIAPGGLRITTDNNNPTPNTQVTSFDFQAFYEKDLENLLSSGKSWLGEPFTSALTDRSFSIPLPASGLTDITVRFKGVARSTAPSRFEVYMNNTQLGNLSVSPVTGNIFDTYATIADGSFSASGPANFSIKYIGNTNAKGWLDFIEITGRSALAIPTEGMLHFRDGRSLNRIGEFLINQANAQTQVWDISNPITPIAIPATLNGSTLRFTRDCATLKEYIAFSTTLKPTFAGTVANQNLHGSSATNMLIITVNALKGEAQRLAAYHQATVVTVDQICNEFAAGIADPTAIRDFVKMHYDKYGVKYLLLFGRASFDYKDRVENNTNMVPTWQSAASFHGINSYMSDDYFGFLDNADDIAGNPLLDVAIGRLPVRNTKEAAAVVDKILGYHNAKSFGPWRNEMTFVADDEDDNLHLVDAEKVSNIIAQEQPAYNTRKFYLDAFPQVAQNGANRYPAANEAINNRMFSGTLVWNYTGHGSFSRLAEETILDETSPENWNNASHLPLLVTATCDFAPFDNPKFMSLGEQLLHRKNGGAIALMTTTRAVFAYSNLVMNANYFRLAFQPGAGGKMLTLGEGAMLAKNETYAHFGDIINNRKFQLLGDPALTLAFPKWRVYTDSINGQPLSSTDTLKALGKYTLKGSVRDAGGSIRTGYNGTVTITVFDKPAGRSTRGNDPTSKPVVFEQQDRLIYKGTQNVQNGIFSYTFVVPKDIAQTSGNGKISYYASNETEDGSGFYNQVAVYGTATAVPADNKGPVIRAWMDSENFINGGLTSDNPLLLLHLQDENGINTAGKDIVAILDDSSRYYVMNDFYEASRGDYREGRVRFPMAGLPPGKHTLTIRAWDTHNNSSTINISFTVVPKSLLVVDNVMNYPNPFSQQTRFVFTHNQQSADLDVVIRIFAATGQIVRTITSTINGQTARYEGVPWNGTADSGAKVTPGIYFYQIAVKSRLGSEKVFGGKLILL